MDLSILVISKNYKLLNRMLKSINNNKILRNKKCELICSWNGSNKDIKKIENIRNLSLKILEIKPYNYASNMNMIIKKSRGDFILAINDDVILDINSIDIGMNFIDQKKEIGLIGGKLRDDKGYLTHGGVSFNFLDCPYHFFEGIIKADEFNFFTKNYSVPAVTGALMLARRKIFTDIYYNEKYKVCGEDIELCLEIRQKLNKKIYLCGSFSGIHEAESTRKTIPIQLKNKIDKKRIADKYYLFINKSNEELINEYQFQLKILKFIHKKKFFLKSHRLHTDWWPAIFINIIKLRIKIFLANNFKKI